MFFEGIEPKDLEKLEKIGNVQSFIKHEHIFREGENGTCFGIILDGSVEVRKSLPNGDYKALVELNACDVIGELGFFGIGTRTASIVAMEDTKILFFERDKFHEFTKSRPAVGMIIYCNMATILAQRLASNDASLMGTIIWALGQTWNGSLKGNIGIQKKPILSVKKST